MSKQYRPWTPEQPYLLPPSPREWLPEGHLAYVVLDVVGELDLSAIEDAIQSKDGRGTRPYPPRLMTALILYGYSTGCFSSRRIARGTYEDVAFRVIAANAHPHFTNVNGFRLQHREALAGLFVQVLKLCTAAGLRTLGHVSLDGSKVQANASKHKAMSYGRMNEQEKKLEEEIRALFERADEIDAVEDAKYGVGVSGDELPEELRRRETRLERIRAAKSALEEEAAKARAAELRENAAALRAKVEEPECATKERREARTRAANAEAKADELSRRDDDDDDHDGNAPSADLPMHRAQTTAHGTPKDKAQRNFTDGDSRIMFRNSVPMQAYNAQAVVSEDQIIVAHGLTNDPTDARQLSAMLERTRENVGGLPTHLTADSGYLSEQNIDACEAKGIDACIGVPKTERGPFPPTTLAGIKRFLMRVKLAGVAAKKLYARRKVIVEPVFGQIKGAMGFRRFSLRGLNKAPQEWAIVCTCHNLLKLFRRRATFAAAS